MNFVLYSGMKIDLMNTSKISCPWLEWYEKFFLLFWQYHAAEWLSGHVAQILAECPLPAAFSLVTSSPVDGRPTPCMHLLPPSFYNKKARSKGTNVGCWLGYLSWKGKRRRKWGLKVISCVSVYHFPVKDAALLFLDFFFKPNKTQTMKPVTSGISYPPI